MKSTESVSSTVQARQRGMAWRAALAAIAVTAVAGLAACGSVSASSAPRAGASGPPSGSSSSSSPLQGSVPVGAGPALCAGISHLTSLTVTRVITLPNHFHFPFPATVKTASPAQVKTVARAACRLPQLPRAPMACPADFGIRYHMMFAAAGHGFPMVTASAGGCSQLTGLDQTRQATPGFWATLGTAIGLDRPAAAAFSGASS